MPVVAGGGMVGTVLMPGVVFVLGVVGVVGAVVFVGGVAAARPATPIDMLDGFTAAPATLPRPALLIMLAAAGAAVPAEFERAVVPAPDEASLPEHAATDNTHPIIHARARTRSTFRYSIFDLR